MMSDDEIRIFPLGDSALTVEFGRTISEELNKKAIALANRLDTESFPGFVEAVPAYASTSIFYDPVKVRNECSGFETAFATIKNFAEIALTKIDTLDTETSRSHKIPVVFDGPDFDDVAKFAGLTADAVVELFIARSYRVYMLGFLPGFTYMGEVDERIAMPRKDSPRTSVPKGSIGLAGKQTGIYSLPSPGGWQLIGRTDVEMFTPNDASPTLMNPGDEVRFIPR
jgi:inhibitor of KinA